MLSVNPPGLCLACTLAGLFLVLGAETKYEKPFLTYDEQADLLISRGLMADREEPVGKLEHVG